MQRNKSFGLFDPMIDPVPETPFGQSLSIIACKARHLLRHRHSEQVIDASSAITWMQNEYFEKAALDRIKEISNQYALSIDGDTLYEADPVDVIGWLMDGADKPIGSSDYMEIARLAKTIPTPENTSSLDALQRGLEFFELDDDMFPDAQEWEYFAVLALHLLSECVACCSDSVPHRSLLQHTTDMSKVLGKAGELAIFAMQAVCHAETEKMNQKVVAANTERRVKELSLKKRRLKGFEATNRPKKVAMARAKEIALQLWQEDTAQEARIGEIADKVYRQLAKEDYTHALPDTAESLKRWIKGIAPEYARQGGKPRKRHG